MTTIFFSCSFIALLIVIFAILLPICLYLVPRKFLCSPQHQNVWYCPQFSASSCHLQIVEWAPRLAPRVNDTDVPKSLSYRPSVAVLSPLEPHLPLTISPRSTAQVTAGCKLPESALSLSFLRTIGSWSVQPRPRPLIQSKTCPQVSAFIGIFPKIRVKENSLSAFFFFHISRNDVRSAMSGQQLSACPVQVGHLQSDTGDLVVSIFRLKLLS